MTENHSIATAYCYTCSKLASITKITSALPIKNGKIITTAFKIKAILDCGHEDSYVMSDRNFAAVENIISKVHIAQVD